MKIAALFSGGKDSTFSLFYYLMQGWDVKCLIVMKSENEDSYMYHTPNIDKAHLQAEALGIPVVEQVTKGDKEKELVDLRSAMEKAKKEYGVEGVCVGALFSDYQQERVNRMCHELELKTFAPLWHKEQKMLIRDMVNAGFKIILQKVAAEGLDASWLNVTMDEKMIAKLEELEKKIQLNPAGEGGEYETYVLDGPIFKKSIEITTSSIKKEGIVAQLLIEEAELKEK